jgi:hypothetical protein
MATASAAISYGEVEPCMRRSVLKITSVNIAGVDDVFVCSNTLRSYLSDPKLQAMGRGSVIPEREMRLTLALAGPSVILTTFTVLAAFFISSVVS